MASCTKCGANLIAQARFCASCGSPITSGSVAPPPPTGKAPSVSMPDPFARTILSDPGAPSVVDPGPVGVSPMAASVMKAQAQPPAARPAISAGAASVSAPLAPAGAPLAPMAAPLAAAPAPAAPAGPSPYAAPAPQQSHSFAPGTLVLVYWADGNRYPGTVLQISHHHVFVAFPNGMQQWIDARYVQVGG
jgi:hypothetical protein